MFRLKFLSIFHEIFHETNLLINTVLVKVEIMCFIHKIIRFCLQDYLRLIERRSWNILLGWLSCR